MKKDIFSSSFFYITSHSRKIYTGKSIFKYYREKIHSMFIVSFPFPVWPTSKKLVFRFIFCYWFFGDKLVTKMVQILDS